MRHVGDAWKTSGFILTSAGLCLDDNLGAVVTLAFYRFGGVANVVVKAASEVGLALGRLRSCQACWCLLYCAGISRLSAWSSWRILWCRLWTYCQDCLGIRVELNPVRVAGLHWIAVGRNQLGFLAGWAIQCGTVWAFGPAPMSAGGSSAGLSNTPTLPMREVRQDYPLSRQFLSACFWANVKENRPIAVVAE